MEVQLVDIQLVTCTGHVGIFSVILCFESASVWSALLHATLYKKKDVKSATVCHHVCGDLSLCARLSSDLFLEKAIKIVQKNRQNEYLKFSCRIEVVKKHIDMWLL